MSFQQSRRDGLLRLAHLDEQTAAVDETMAMQRERFDKLANKEPVKVISSFNLFQTPREVARDLAIELGGVTGKRILEPSAGLGRLLEAVWGQGTPDETVAVESSADCCEHLFGYRNLRLIQDDFLACDFDRLGGPFDAVVMNPPFKMGRDIKHITHAHSMLCPGGKLVALCFDGVRQNKILRPMVDTWTLLPKDSFASEGTRASVVMLTWKAAISRRSC